MKVHLCWYGLLRLMVVGSQVCCTVLVQMMVVCFAVFVYSVVMDSVIYTSSVLGCPVVLWHFQSRSVSQYCFLYPVLYQMPDLAFVYR